ncbi:hypothetical protein EUX98_g8495 [Antrodiella citrinella]|uniref:Uncharacterized protein n=1 Tax=Antrodiella citrinella TaxID=2447956 RepID=A0A4S4M6K7_9APHY|nr:hypothetical protein EUX98_g8495 [Antrodiella citrinella]
MSSPFLVAPPRFSGLLVRREWDIAAEALHAYTEDPEFVMKYLFYTSRWRAEDDICDDAEKDGLTDRFDTDWAGKAAKSVGTSVFLQYIICLSVSWPSFPPSLWTTRVNSPAYVIASSQCLVDSNDSVPTVPGYLLSLGAFIVQAGKMNTASIEWLETARATPYYMNSKQWSTFELVAARMLHPRSTESSLEIAAYQYGLSSGVAFNFLSRGHRDLEEDTSVAIHCIRDDADYKTMMMRGGKHDFTHSAAYRLMCVAPDELTYNKRNIF